MFAGLFLVSLFIVSGGGAQSPSESAKPVWTMEILKVMPGKFGPTLGYLDDNYYRCASARKPSARVPF